MTCVLTDMQLPGGNGLELVNDAENAAAVLSR